MCELEAIMKPKHLNYFMTLQYMWMLTLAFHVFRRKENSSPNFSQSLAPVLVCLLLLLREHDSYKGNIELG